VKRRDFITVLAGATAWVSTSRAQEPPRVIGVLGSASYGSIPGVEAALLQGLKDTGFIEGRNLGIEWRWAEGQYNRLPSLAGELVSRGVAVIVCWDTPAAFAAKAATRTIPIVFLTGADPVKLGLVDSFNRPGGNLTGASALITGLGPKHLELLHELLPTASAIALLVNPSNPNTHAYTPEMRAAAITLGLRLEVLTAETDSDLEESFRTMVRQSTDALVVMSDLFLIDRYKQLVALAAHHAVPAIYPILLFAEVGGLMSYGTPYVALYHRIGTYTGKLLKGAKPADLPIEQSTTFELVINLQTAKALGLTVPYSLLARADKVIE
jgi:putative tryptophan/tyrosine transport system substrate-binding protein